MKTRIDRPKARAERGRRALLAYIGLKRARHRRDDPEDHIVPLLADLFHHCMENELDWQGLQEQASRVVYADLAGSLLPHDPADGGVVDDLVA